MLVQASLLTVHRVHAADQDPASPAQEIGHLLQRAPGQGRPCLLLTEQQYQPAGGTAGEGELSPPGRSGQLIPGRDSPPNRSLDLPCHVAIMAGLRRDVDAL